MVRMEACGFLDVRVSGKKSSFGNFLASLLLDGNHFLVEEGEEGAAVNPEAAGIQKIVIIQK